MSREFIAGYLIQPDLLDEFENTLIPKAIAKPTLFYNHVFVCHFILYIIFSKKSLKLDAFHILNFIFHTFHHQALEMYAAAFFK